MPLSDHMEYHMPNVEDVTEHQRKLWLIKQHVRENSRLSNEQFGTRALWLVIIGVAIVVLFVAFQTF